MASSSSCPVMILPLNLQLLLIYFQKCSIYSLQNEKLYKGVINTGNYIKPSQDAKELL